MDKNHAGAGRDPALAEPSPITHVPTMSLNNGVAVPVVAFGVFKIGDDAMNKVARAAIDSGYRAFDTAPMYGNERSLGRALADSGVRREDLFITTKVPNEAHGFRSTLESVHASINRLDSDYLDMCLIHWPLPGRGLYLETWRALERLYFAGKIRAIGVSNFQTQQLLKVVEIATVAPAVNQIELHPLLTQSKLIDVHRRNGIRTQAWAPLARGRLAEDPTLDALAERYEVSSAQIVLRWHVQQGIVPLPKSSSPDRIRTNIDIFDFQLTSAEMDEISTLNQDYRTGPHPDEVL